MDEYVTSRPLGARGDGKKQTHPLPADGRHPNLQVPPDPGVFERFKT